MSSEDSTRATLLVPGRAKTLEGWTEGLRERGFAVQEGRLRGKDLAFAVPFEWIDNDGGFGRAFSFGTVSEAEQAAIEAAPGGLLLRLPVDLRQAREAVVRLVATLGEPLHDPGPARQSASTAVAAPRSVRDRVHEAQALEAREVPVRRGEHGPMLDGQRGQVGVGREVPRYAQAFQQAE